MKRSNQSPLCRWNRQALFEAIPHILRNCLDVVYVGPSHQISAHNAVCYSIRFNWFQVCLICTCMLRGHITRGELGMETSWRHLEWERERERVVQRTPKRRNEWTNKVNNRRDVSKCFQKNPSLRFPRQREVQVGSAPYITNYVCVWVRGCASLLSSAIHMQKRKKGGSVMMFAGHFILTRCVCVFHPCQAVFCQYISRHDYCLPHTHTQTRKQNPPCLFLCVWMMFTKENSERYKETPVSITSFKSPSIEHDAHLVHFVPN